MKKLKILTHTTRISDLDDLFDDFDDSLDLRREHIQHKQRLDDD